MKRRAVIPTIILLLIATAASGQEGLDTIWENASIAWDEGRYVHAMELMLEILEVYP